MAYRARQAPGFESTELRLLADWVYDELKALEANFTNLDIVRFATRFSEPEKKRAGDVVLADGTSWNPGAGQGFYGYYAGAWHKLG